MQEGLSEIIFMLLKQYSFLNYGYQSMRLI